MQGEAILQRLVSKSHSHELKPMKKLEKTLRERIDNIVTYGTNRAPEGINSKIMSNMRRPGGYWNIENFKKAMFFYCGEQDIYPR